MSSYLSLQGESTWIGVERRSGEDRRSGRDRRSDHSSRVAWAKERGVQVLLGPDWDRRSGQDRRGHPLYQRRQQAGSSVLPPVPVASSGTAMPALQTERLIIRPLVLDDLEAVHQVQCRAWDVPENEWESLLPEREQWVRWSVANYGELAKLHQPPYGERAIVRRNDGRLIGLVGVVPALGPFAALDGFPGKADPSRFSPEVGLYWSVDPEAQGRGYASEAASRVICYLFETLRLDRVVATTTFDNAPSIAVMQKLSMAVLHNTKLEPAWFQVVGVLEAR